MLRALIVYNPKAGRMPSRQIVEGAARGLRAHGWRVEIEATGGPGDATVLARSAAQAGVEAVVVAGGDGTLSEAADGLAGSGAALGVLPIGTANVWARELRMPLIATGRASEVEAFAEGLCRARVKALDMGRLGRRHFLLWAGLGLDGHIVSRIEPRGGFAKALGQPYYVAASFVAGIDWRGVPMRVTVDDDTASGDMLLVLIGNVRGYGGDLFTISPQAKLDDGRLEVWVFEGRTYADTLRLARELYRGRHLDHPRVKHLTGRRVAVVAERPVPSQCDGEPLSRRTEIDVEVAPRALRALVPDSAPPDLFT